MLKVESVFWNGSTASTSPMVTVPAPIEARRPPPFVRPMVTPWSLTRSTMASATRSPIGHSCGAAGLAAAVDAGGDLGDDAGLELLDRAGELLDAGERVRVGGDAGVEELVSPMASVTTPCVVEGEGDVAEVLGVGAGLDDGDGVAVGAVDHERILEGRVLGGVGVERVAVAADDEVDAGHRRRHRLVAEGAEVAEEDDLVHALGLRARPPRRAGSRPGRGS